MENYDKFQHFVLGALVAFSPVYPLAAVLIVAFGKELYDFYHKDKHTCDAMDAIATIVGGLVVIQLLN